MFFPGWFLGNRDGFYINHFILFFGLNKFLQQYKVAFIKSGNIIQFGERVTSFTHPAFEMKVAGFISYALRLIYLRKGRMGL
jgi:hypothetical protein